MNPGIELLLKERNRATEARDEMNRLLGSFDHVLSYLAHTSKPIPDPVTVETTAALPAAPIDQSRLPAGFWDREIVNAIKSGARKSGEIWADLQQRFKLPDERKTAYYQALAQTRFRRYIYRKGASYFIRKGTVNGSV